MNISINSAISAYKNAANITKSVADSPDISSGDSVFSSLITSPAANTISSLQNSEKSVFNNLTKKADITDVVTAISEAESALKTVVAIRDRLVSAFQKIQDMPI